MNREIQAFLARLKDGRVIKLFLPGDGDFKIIKKKFLFPKIIQAKEFNTDASLTADEWFYLNFKVDAKTPDVVRDIRAEIISYLADNFSSGEVNLITPGTYISVNCLYLAEKDIENKKRRIIFNRVLPKFLVKSRTFIGIKQEGAEISSSPEAIDFSYQVDAFWDEEADRLYFRSFDVIKPLFQGIEYFYREATNVEVNLFLKQNFFVSTLSANSVLIRNRKNIAIIKDKLSHINLSDPKTQQQYRDYAKDYPGVHFNVNAAGQIELHSNEDLTDAINLVMERFFTKPISKEKMVALAEAGLRGPPHS